VNRLSSAPLRLPQGKIPSLDGVRGLSFLIVFVAHAGLDRIVPGRFGVNIFFLLSGYLITTLLIREREKVGFISLKLFYARRSLRIFPPMYAILGLTLLYLWLTHGLAGVTIGGVCAQAFYYQNYYFHGGKNIIPGLGPLWSLAVEEHFYLFFPPLMLLFRDRLQMNYQQIARALLWICGVILVWRCCVVAFMPNGLSWARDCSDTRADSILFGCALACIEYTPLRERIFERKLLERVLVPASLLILLVTFLVRNDIFRETLRYTMQAISLAPLLIYVIYYPQTWIGKILNSTLLTRIGVLSYSLYLLHYSVLLEMHKYIPSSKLAAGIISLIVAIGLAYLVHLFVESPTEKWRRQLRHTDERKQPTRRETMEATAIVVGSGAGD
jgi:peptidoglycan/LPS O-acetylase OafA/YrhL